MEVKARGPSAFAEGMLGPLDPGTLTAFLFDQDVLLPAAGWFVRAVDAARPAAGTALSFQEFFACPLDAALACLCLFSVLNPADELVTAKRRQFLPQIENYAIRLDRAA